MYNYQTKGVCAKSISFDIVDNKITNVKFIGGCQGNIMGITKLVEGMDVNEVIEKLKGIPCGWKNTSCPDQLAIAIKEVVDKK